MKLYNLLDFYEEWFKGSLKLSYMIREVGYQIGPLKDPNNKNPFRRNPYALEGFRLLLKEQSKGLRNLNIFLSIALYEDLELSNPIYDTLHYDFDSKENPVQAIKAAREFALSVRKRYGCDPVLYLSGLHGAHVIIPLAKPTDWEGYQLLWRTLVAPYKYLNLYVDPNMLQHNRLDRIPCTWNIKNVEGKVKKGFAKLIDINGRPLRCEEFEWENYQPLDPSSIEITVFKAHVEAPKLIIPRRKVANKLSLPSSIEELAGSEAVPPCIKNIVEAMVKSGDLDHYQRIALVLYLKWVGFSVDQVVGFFGKYAKDFNEKITRYQVEYLYGLRGKREDWLMYSCNKMKQLGICLNCGWNRNPVTYTYVRARVPEEIRQRFFAAIKGGVAGYTAYQASPSASGLGQAAVTLRRVQVSEIPSWLQGFLRDTGLWEFSYNDVKLWFEKRYGKISAKKWHSIERELRKLAEQGVLGRKYLVDNKWVDYGSEKIRNPPSKTVKFYLKDIRRMTRA